MRVILIKAIRPPKPGAGKALVQGKTNPDDGIDAADVDDDKPAHEHLRELADVLEKRDGADGSAGAGQDENAGADAGAAGDGDGDEDGAGAGDGDEGEGEFGPSNVSPGDFVAFMAGEFEGSGKVSAAGEHGCTVTDKSGRDWQIHWDEITGNQAAAGGDDDGAGAAGGDPAAGAAVPAAKGQK